MNTKALQVVMLWAAPLLAVAHGGGLNAEGCHNNRKTGDYHCHRAPVVAPAAPAARPLVQPTPDASAVVPQANGARKLPNGQTCFVGPRGGTYTITASGKKNYGGC